MVLHIVKTVLEILFLEQVLFMDNANDPDDRLLKIKTTLPMYPSDINHILDNYARGDFIEWFFAKETSQQGSAKLFEKSTEPNASSMIQHHESNLQIDDILT